MLLERVNLLLLEKGFIVRNVNSFFDILARNKNSVLMIKVLTDANSIYSDTLKEMNKVAIFTGCIPIIIAEKGGGVLEDNVVYSRNGVYTINSKTFENFIDNKSLFIRSTRAGLTASINSEKFTNILEKTSISLAEIAISLGVSKKMIVHYNTENPNIDFRRALRLYDILGDVFAKIDLFSFNNNVEYDYSSDVSRKYSELGFDVAELRKGPINIIAKSDETMIFTKVGDKVSKNAFSLSLLIEGDDLVIFDKKKPKDIPAIQKGEFLDIENAKELLKVIDEF